jgi:hypothetical protein
VGGMQPCWPARPRVRTRTLRRLIGSSVVVGPASRSRRHERPSRMAVSRRSGKSRPPRWAARLQARVGSGSASPPPGRTDKPGQRTVSCASLAWRAWWLLADAPMLPAWEVSARGHWAQLRRDPRPLLHRAGERDPKRRSGTSRRLVLVVVLGHLPAARLPHCPVRWQTHGRKTARPLTTFHGVEPVYRQVEDPLPSTTAALEAG